MNLTTLMMMTASAQSLLAPWAGDYGGLPPFDQPAVSDFAPALQAGMDAYQAEIDDIAANKAKPSFDNTLLALEDAGRGLSRVQTIYGVYLSTQSTPALRAVQTEMAPKMSAFYDGITQNQALFARIEAVASSKKLKKLSPAAQRLAEQVHLEYVKDGARLDPAAKQRLAAIHQQLASLTTRFSQNLLADGESFIVLDDKADLDGLPEGAVAALAAAAAERELPGKWVVVNSRSSVMPFLTYASRRDLREQVWRAFYDRGDNGGDTDNNAIVTQILALRAEKAKLLGFETYAHWKLQGSMAATPDKAMALMLAVWKPAVARVVEEVAAQQAIADAEGAGVTIAPWDYRYYQEEVRLDRYDIDQNEVSAYLELEQLREGMFWMAGQLYGLHFAQVQGVPVVHPDVRVWEVTDAQGAHVGLWYFDPYARDGKRYGAWMNAYRDQQRFRRVITPLVSNNSNFVKGAEGAPVLLSWDDANTMFHEFGHAIHALLSDVDYPSQAGTSVTRDYVEFPSQLHEHWLSTPELLGRFAKHYQTGEPMPAALIAKLEAAATFNQGFATVEYLASALIDMKLHLAGDGAIDPDAFERDTLTELGMPPQVVMRHRTPQFGHIFSGGSYAAGYYSYLWADTLSADAAEAFVEAGSMYDAATAQRLVQHVLSVGDTVDPAEGFKAFRGREVSVDALMRDRGFAPPLE